MHKRLFMQTSLLNLFFLFLFSGIAVAQIKVTGVIKDAHNEALPGASIIVKGTNIGTTTDSEGKYTIEVSDPNATLQFSFVGYESQEILLNGQTVLNITLAERSTQMEEVIVIGYGTQKRKDLTGSVAVIDVGDVSKVATNDIAKAIQGQVAGVQVHGAGQPGAVPEIKIRGIGSFNNNSPLYIIDGIQAPIIDFPISDIESIQILKDGSAAAIYGSRAANGVVIITTKRGKAGKLKITYNGYGGVQYIPKKLNVTNREEYQMLVNEATINANDPIKYVIMPANDPTNPLYVSNIDTDWQDEVFKTGKIMNHTINTSGSSETSSYNISLNYTDHTGTVVGNGPKYTRYAFGINSEHKLGKLKIGESVHYSVADQTLMSFVHNSTLLNFTVQAIPTIPVYDNTTIDGYGASNKTFDGSYTANVVGFNNIIDTRTRRNRFIGTIYGEYEIIKDLKYKLSAGYERLDYRDFWFKPKHNLGWFYVNDIAKLKDNRGYGETKTIEQTLTYDKTLGKHKFTLMAGTSLLEGILSRSFGLAEGFMEPYFKQLSRGETTSVTSDENKNRLLSYFGRAIYDLGDKYMLQATIRRDGSSRFSQDYRWGVFPAIAAAWKLHNEDFIKSLSFLSQLKLRASYGELGNQEIINYGYQAYINPYTHAVFSNKLAPGAIQIDFATPDIRWESKKSTNIGLDMGLLNNKITLTAEYYVNKSEDLLVRVSIPEATGVYNWNSPYVNGASMKNSGMEFTLGYKEKFNNLNVSVNANISTLKNEVLALGYGDKPLYGSYSRTAIGTEVGELYGHVVEGIFQNQAEINTLNAVSPTGFYQVQATAPGDIKFKDINGRDSENKLTGKPDGKVDDDDRTYLGSAFPNLLFGFSLNLDYKGFDLNLMASGVSGNKIVNVIRQSIETGGGWDNYSKDMLNRWQYEGQQTDIPRVVIGDPNGNARFSDRFVEDGKYLKINNIELGYTLPVKILKTVKISSLRIYASGQNVYTFTKYKGFDPDFSNDGLLNRGVDNGGAANREFTDANAGSLPNPRTWLLGIQLGF